MTPLAVHETNFFIPIQLPENVLALYVSAKHGNRGILAQCETIHKVEVTKLLLLSLEKYHGLFSNISSPGGVARCMLYAMYFTELN